MCIPLLLSVRTVLYVSKHLKFLSWNLSLHWLCQVSWNVCFLCNLRQCSQIVSSWISNCPRMTAGWSSLLTEINRSIPHLCLILRLYASMFTNNIVFTCFDNNLSKIFKKIFKSEEPLKKDMLLPVLDDKVTIIKAMQLDQSKADRSKVQSTRGFLSGVGWNGRAVARDSAICPPNKSHMH